MLHSSRTYVSLVPRALSPGGRGLGTRLNLLSKHDAFALSTPPTASSEQSENLYNKKKITLIIQCNGSGTSKIKILIMLIAHMLLKVGVVSLIACCRFIGKDKSCHLYFNETKCD